MLTDEQIMQQVVEGDINKSGILFERYQGAMYNYYLRSTYDTELSKDLTQQVFIKLIKYRNSYKSVNSFKSWLYRVATNVKHDHYRKEKSYKNRNEIYSATREEMIDPHDKIEKSESEKILHRALNKLPEDQREVIWMTRFEKMKYADVAKIYECTESAIKVRVHRAMKRLKSEYLQLEQL
ncbi:RNA polymerase sigma factor [Saprospiraceae bacterium]|nr:RNA polymerase sigma factor [Saprospiraceae bacterium]